MNKTYIKRQITLNELGFPMNEEVEELLCLFNTLFIPELLIPEPATFLSNRGYAYYQNGNIIIFINQNNGHTWIEREKIYKTFAYYIINDYRDCNEHDRKISEILTYLLNKFLDTNNITRVNYCSTLDYSVDLL